MSILNSCELKIGLKYSPGILSLFHVYYCSLVPERLFLIYPCWSHQCWMLNYPYTPKNIFNFSLFAYNGEITVWQHLDIFSRQADNKWDIKLSVTSVTNDARVSYLFSFESFVRLWLWPGPRDEWDTGGAGDRADVGQH